MGMPDTQNDQYFTYGDYLKWSDEERWELIDGRPFAMTPAPTERHQSVSMALSFILYGFFEGKPCRVYAAPFDVRLPKDGEPDDRIDTVVQPDLVVVCDQSKLDERGMRGAPDLVIEILSESTSKRDMGDKLRLYERHGVNCYIIADPWGKTLTIRNLEAGGHYGDPEIFAVGRQMPIRIFEGLVLDLGRVFADL